jgi:triosephosphate isomerase
MAEDSAVIAGAQNFYFEDSGAFTGEVPRRCSST